MKGRCRRQYDEIGNEIRECHPNICIDFNPPKLFRGLLWRFFEWLFLWLTFHLFDFFSGLPEQKIRADRGAQYCDESSQVISLKRNGGYESPSYHFRPVDLNDENRAHVGEQGKGHPL